MTAAYLKCSTETRGELRGPVRDRDPLKDGSIALIALEHGLISPRDASTGMATGRKQHLPIAFTKETDKTSTHFYEFLARNELLRTVEIMCFGIDRSTAPGSGRERLQYKITLNKAFVHKVEFVGRTDAAAQADQRLALTERISLVYESIRWEWLHPNTAAEDMFKPASQVPGDCREPGLPRCAATR